ncbi:MAG: pyruvate formate lyase-activating protein [Clostridia bacterium]|nr:pyruvate formate lyase-activating protein [Clostridia bacterium]
MSKKVTGKIHSIQTLGTLDGPGVRFVVFTQGCNLRCHCCHNPDTWAMAGGTEVTPEEIVEKAKRYRGYYGEKGGITVSGGEPLLQCEFVYELFCLCKENGINTCLDTSGSVINEMVKKVLAVTDRVLLDIKYTDDDPYRKYVGCELSAVLEFLEILQEKNIPTTIRQVVIPGKNDSEENYIKLKKIVDSHSCVDKTELLPFRKICTSKYEALGIDFPFKNICEPKKEDIDKYQKMF